MVLLFAIDHYLMWRCLTNKAEKSIATDTRHSLCQCVHQLRCPVSEISHKSKQSPLFSTVAFLFRHATAKCNS